MSQQEQPRIDVLDHGYVQLVDTLGNEMSIVRAARVSYNAEPRNDGSDEKLLRYLLKNRHTSPFESVVFTFEVQAPIFILRQWHRHRTWSYNEVSARYSELPELYYVPAPYMIGKQSASNKQMRDITEMTYGDLKHATTLADAMRISNTECFELYKQLLEEGVPRELARTVLPLATYSRMFATVDLHNLIHFLQLRLHAHAQYEIQVYAKAMLELIEPVVPTVANYLKESIHEQVQT